MPWDVLSGPRQSRAGEQLGCPAPLPPSPAWLPQPFPQQLPSHRDPFMRPHVSGPRGWPWTAGTGGWWLGAVATATSATPGAWHLVILAGRDVPAFLRVGPGPAPATPGAAPAPGPAREIQAQPGESPPLQGCGAAERQEPQCSSQSGRWVGSGLYSSVPAADPVCPPVHV